MSTSQEYQKWFVRHYIYLMSMQGMDSLQNNRNDGYLTSPVRARRSSATKRAWRFRLLMVLSIVVQLMYSRFFSSKVYLGRHQPEFQHEEPPPMASLSHRNVSNHSTTRAHAGNTTTVHPRKNFPVIETTNASIGMEIVTTGTSPNETRVELHMMPPNTSGAYIHIGKCGGSTMTSQLTNGCHSWVAKPCNTAVENETIISKSTTYYHTPDFARSTIREQLYSFYVVQIRDPLARFRSIFGAYHIDNAPFREEKDKYVSGGKQFGSGKSISPSVFPALRNLHKQYL
jgi:hypothetical protein